MHLQTVSHCSHHGYPHTLLLCYLEISQDNCHIDQNLVLLHNLLACLAKYLPHAHVIIPNADTQFGWVNITVKIKHITPQHTLTHRVMMVITSLMK